MPRPLNGDNQHALMLSASSGNALRNNPPLLGNEPLDFLLVFVINVIFFVVAEAAGSFFSDLLRCGASWSAGPALTAHS